MPAGAVGVVVCLAAGCATSPIVLASGFVPPSAWTLKHRAVAEPVCRIAFGVVRDARDDTRSMGSIGVRPIRSPDSMAWLRSALTFLDRDARIRVVDRQDNADLVLDVDLIKAYVTSITTDKTASVVLHVRYSRHGSELEQADYRGDIASWNWVSGEEEAKSALNRAMAQALDGIDRETVKLCTP